MAQLCVHTSLNIHPTHTMFCPSNTTCTWKPTPSIHRRSQIHDFTACSLHASAPLSAYVHVPVAHRNFVTHSICCQPAVVSVQCAISAPNTAGAMRHLHFLVSDRHHTMTGAHLPGRSKTHSHKCRLSSAGFPTLVHSYNTSNCVVCSLPVM